MNQEEFVDSMKEFTEWRAITDAGQMVDEYGILHVLNLLQQTIESPEEDIKIQSLTAFLRELRRR